jgi:hypothetical protein
VIGKSRTRFPVAWQIAVAMLRQKDGPIFLHTGAGFGAR